MYRNLPLLAAKPISLLPFSVQAFFLEKTLTNVFNEQINDGTCQFLQNRWLRLTIHDLNLNFYFTLSPQRTIQIRKHAIDNVSISGNLNEFILLAARKEDPDTLFFQRRLVIEGDTELGLEVKNLIDSVDLSALSKELRFLIAGAGEWVALSTES